ncbi:MAG TPA: quinoprotein dehydrogenase-associated SoxYZ-like carrier [Hyphomicrobiaceae bacterium]|nr:quinoprotein dehydrogenase-associated SoxYZ-like carrier [Hyphomicrobiaceae bacterium]
MTVYRISRIRRIGDLRSLALGLALLGAASTAALAAGPGDSPERVARWKAIAGQIFGERPIEPTDTLIKLDLPKRAEDAALVPVTLTMPEKDRIKAVTLVIDDNPSPMAAHIVFGPAAGPGALQLRVRIDTYTNVHAVAETTDGQLYETAAFVKASGGCSAPAAASDVEAMKGIGEMRTRFAGDGTLGKPMTATLMVRHPNFNGMQMDQVTRHYTPARYIDKLSVSYGNAKVLDLETDISLSTNPVITFSFVPDGKGRLTAVATDTANGRWEQSFDAPAATN